VEMSERVTWENCPVCRRPAVVGWSNGRPIEFDCPGGCRLNAAHIQFFADRRGRAPIDWLTRY
jgi:hypothetical protein